MMTTNRKQCTPKGLPTLIADELSMRTMFQWKGTTPREWALQHGLNYPTVHKIMTGYMRTNRKNGVGRKIVDMLNREMAGWEISVRRRAG